MGNITKLILIAAAHLLIMGTFARALNPMDLLKLPFPLARLEARSEIKNDTEKKVVQDTIAIDAIDEANPPAEDLVVEITTVESPALDAEMNNTSSITADTVVPSVIAPRPPKKPVANCGSKTGIDGKSHCTIGKSNGGKNKNPSPPRESDLYLEELVLNALDDMLSSDDDEYFLYDQPRSFVQSPKKTRTLRDRTVSRYSKRSSHHNSHNLQS